jgi:small subunit ribosomal protein S13
MPIKFINRSVISTQKVGKFISSIYGISRYTTMRFCRQLGISYSSSIQDIPVAKRGYIEAYFLSKPLGIDLQRRVQNKVSDKIRFGGYSGLRLGQGLPSRGQRSKTNAQTCKKKFKLKISIISKLLKYAS